MGKIAIEPSTTFTGLKEILADSNFGRVVNERARWPFVASSYNRKKRQEGSSREETRAEKLCCILST
jgi:hypothetical protein